MQIIMKFRDDDARRTEYYLQKFFKSRKSLQSLAKVAILRVAGEAARLELKELNEADKNEP